MAVARITAPIEWFCATAEAVSDLPKLKRELLRATERRSLMVELNADEVRELAQRLPTDKRVARAMLELTESELRERDRRGNPNFYHDLKARRTIRNPKSS